MGKLSATKSGLAQIADLLPIERGMLGPTYDWLLKFLGKAPRDEIGRIPLDAISKNEFQALMELPRRSPGGLVFRGEPDVVSANPATYVAKWPRHAMGYAAGETGTSKKPTGFLSVYDVPWDKLPEYGMTRDSDILASDIMARLRGREGIAGLPEEVRNAGGARLLNVQDWALGPNGKWDDMWQHAEPQAIITDKKLLQRKAKGGLIQMKDHAKK